MASPSADFRNGLIFGLIAYISWGLIPLFFAQLMTVPAEELLAHRIVWSLGILGMMTALRTGAFADLRKVLTSPKLVLWLLISAVFLATNWLLYIFATVTQQVTQASIGYYMMPLVNAFFARMFLGERLRMMHYLALAIIAAGVIAASILQGAFTWIAVALPVTFGFYGLVRKKLPVDSMTGLTVETLLLFVPSLAFLILRGVYGTPAFGTNWTTNAWLMFSGIATVLPLLTYTLSIRRLPLLTQSFIQFLSPTVQFLLAVGVLNEEVTSAKLVAMICVWMAVLIFISDALMQARQMRRAIAV